MGASRVPRGEGRFPFALRVGLLMAALVVVLDQATKELVEELLSPGAFVPLVGRHVGWQLVHNPGGAFGLPAPPWIFLVVTLLVVAIVARALPATRSVLQATAYGLLLAGALGNVIDRLLRPGGDGPVSGHVVDFVAWGTFPRFNVADSAITVGFVLLLLALWAEERRAARSADDDPAPADIGGDEPGSADPRDRGGGDVVVRSRGAAGPHDAGDPGPAARREGR